jgi:hypothetical protein
MREIKGCVGATPITRYEWWELKPMIKKVSESLKVEGAAENLWEKI